MHRSASHTQMERARMRTMLRSSSVTLGMSAPPMTTGYRTYHRHFSQAEVNEVRGAMAEEVRKDLRAVHYDLGTDKPKYESCAVKQQVGGSLPYGVTLKEGNAMNEACSRGSQGMQRCLVSSDGRDKYPSDYTGSFRHFSRAECDAVRGSMNKELIADLRAVHYELGRDRPGFESDAHRMLRTGSYGEKAKLAEEKQKDLRAVHYQLGTSKAGCHSLYKSGFVEYSKKQQDEVRGAMNPEMKKDLRAVHYDLGYVSDPMYHHT
mmetsp:Transcript_72131/g.136197  ORF Transcript_72131/g.136197 Transcript_72131/m.136197 type:complete len:263 (+) Transcript_72131:61-849(+)